ncbi:MAG TPA: hypothetical protein VE959_24030 [Bryobacteraceae bacterium]|nr:conserved hypothetical protein [Candidatus Sulfopaludibacter sp. SbA4]HYW45954.1 hypothetical protein [Bryobacteraceae bacterium]
METQTKRVRDYTLREYIEPARRRGDVTVKVVAGEVQKGVQLSNRVPLVCQALRSRKFLEENGLILEKWEGPPSGMSTTVTFIYRLRDRAAEPGRQPAEDPLMRLWGIGKEVFQGLGGGEEFIRREREHFHDADGGEDA